MASSSSNGSDDPMRSYEQSAVTQSSDIILLHFVDGRQLFCNLSKPKAELRFLKKSFSTKDLIGLPYGTVLEQCGNKLVVVDDSKLVPDLPELEASDNEEQRIIADNRALQDDNTAQKLHQYDLEKLKQDSSKSGAEIVQDLIQNSSTFTKKNPFSREKYIRKKQSKYQLRCRIVRCHAMSIVEAMYLKDPKKIMNLRHDTMAQILSYANLSAGCQALVFETTLGIVTGAVAERLGGYGRILSIYSGQQHSFADILSRYNLNFVQNQSIHWVHAGDVFGDVAEEDDEAQERDMLEWPCPLQSHTRNYVQTALQNDTKRTAFLEKRQARFIRKFCRVTPLESYRFLQERKCDSVIVAVRYDPTATLLQLLPYLASSCPFVVFCEFLEPLTECFKTLQDQNLAVNLRLSDCWMREYQILPERTHPHMNMSQSGGFLLSGIKLDEKTGINELDPEKLQVLKLKHGRARHRQRSKPKKAASSLSEGTPSKRQRLT